MILLNHSDRRHIAELMLTNNYLLIINEKRETEAYRLLRIQCDDSVKARHRRMVEKMNKGVANGPSV